VKVLVDECVDWRLCRDIVGHEVKTARQMGWSTIKNGELLALAAKEFDVFVTVDRNLSFNRIFLSSRSQSSFYALPRIASLIFSLSSLSCLHAFPVPSEVLLRTWGSNPALNRTPKQRRCACCLGAGERRPLEVAVPSPPVAILLYGYLAGFLIPWLHGRSPLRLGPGQGPGKPVETRGFLRRSAIRFCRSPARDR